MPQRATPGMTTAARGALGFARIGLYCFLIAFSLILFFPSTPFVIWRIVVVERRRRIQRFQMDAYSTLIYSLCPGPRSRIGR